MYRVNCTTTTGESLYTVYMSAETLSLAGTSQQGDLDKKDATPAGSGGGGSGSSYGEYSGSSAYSSSNESIMDDAIEFMSKGFTSTNPDWFEVFAEITADSNFFNVTYDDTYYQKLSYKYYNALGYPPKYNMDVDVQYSTQDSESGVDIMPGIGRVFAKTILSNPPILSICPGKIKMFPNLIGTERENMLEALTNVASGNTSLVDKIKGDESAKFSGKLYSFEADTAEYSMYVNALCRACAIIMGLGDEEIPQSNGAKCSTFDYSYWAIRNRYDNVGASAADTDTSIFRNFFSNLVNTGSRIATSLVEETTYMNFFLNGTETSVNESMNTEVSSSPLDSMFSQVNELGSTINYFTGSSFNVGSDDASVTEALADALKTGNATLDGLVDLGKNFLKGGKVVFPLMINGAKFGKSISCSTKFVSTYGDKLSIFLKCIVPICHFLPFALPRQLSDNMYTYPFLIRASEIGCFHVDAGVVTSLNIVRGGSDDMCWTVDSLPTEWEVQFEITPIVDELMLSSTNHPVLFCKNENLIDYLGNMCGFDLLAQNYSTRSEMCMAFFWNMFTGYPRTLHNRVTDFLYNKLYSFTKVSWGS